MCSVGDAGISFQRELMYGPKCRAGEAYPWLSMSDQILQTSGEMESVPLISTPPVLAASFTRRVALTFATRVTMVVGSFGASIVVARWLSARGLGELAVINVTISLAVQIASVGLPS